MEVEENNIIDFISNQGASSSKELYDNLNFSFSYATLKRKLADLVKKEYLSKTGKVKQLSI